MSEQSTPALSSSNRSSMPVPTSPTQPITPPQIPTDPSNVTESGRFAYKWKVLISVLFGIFMIILDSTVVNVAFQTLRSEYNASLNDAQWVISIYVLALGITTPVSGFLGDRFGTKRVYLAGLTLFVIGSVLCGFAPTLGMLIVARAIQGIGGGMAQPLGPAMLYRAFPPKEIGTALGLFGIALVVAPALGPLLGGSLVDAGLWRYIFFINLPIGIVGVFLGSRFLRNEKRPIKPVFDPMGLLTAAVGFGSVLYAASIAETQGWTSQTTILWFVVGIVSLTAFAIIELFVVRDPMLNLRLYANRTFLNATLVGYVATVALFGAEFLMPVYLQAMRGRTALESGTILLGVALASGITTPLAGRIYDKTGPRILIIIGFAILCVNTWQLSNIEPLTPISYLVFLLVLRGLAVGLTLQTTFTTALGSVPRDQLPRGSSLQNSTRFVVQAVAVAAMATILASTVSPQVRAMQEQMSNNSAAQAAGDSASTAAGVAPNATSQAHFGLCETPGVPTEQNVPAAAKSQPATAQAQLRGVLQQACDENILGFEKAYRVTFYASIVALIIGAFLPGWPGRWAGRAAMQGAPMPAGGH